MYGSIFSVFCASGVGNSALLIVCSSIFAIGKPIMLSFSFPCKESKICIHGKHLLLLNSFHNTPSTFPLSKKKLSRVRRVRLPPISVQNSGVTVKRGADDKDVDGSMEKDLLVVGPGVLGRLVAENWLQDNPSCVVFGQTKTTNHHGELQNLGIKPIIKGSELRRRFPYVIFCAPPSGSEDYPTEVRAAIQQWSREGSFLFTSSSAVYDCNDNGSCSEDCPIVPIGRNPRTDILLMAESEVLKIGGNVVRLAGLYKLDRGAHMYYLKKGIVDVRPDHIINLIHYEDAASLCKVILEKRYHGHVFMGCDDRPLSREKMMEYVYKSKKFEEKFQGFTGVAGPLGKQMKNTKTRHETGWVPKYASFADFLGVTS